MDVIKIEELLEVIETMRRATDKKLEELESKIGKTHAEYHEYSKLTGEAIAYIKVTKMLWEMRVRR